MFKCDVCGKEFAKKQSFTNHHRWHSNQFKERMLKQVECALCGKKLNGIGALNAHRFWCKKNNDLTIKQRQDNNRNEVSIRSKGNKYHKITKIKTKCAYCNKDIMVFLYRIEANEHNFCSKECYYHYGKDHLNDGTFKKGQHAGDKHPQWKGGFTKVPCNWCSKEVEIRPSRYKDNNYHAFCTNECYHKWRSKYIRGKNHPEWNPDRDKISKRNYTLRFNYDIDFREKIKEFQYYCDIFDGSPLEENAHLHHFNFDKSNDAHFIIGDLYCNVGFINNKNHGKMQNKMKNEYYKEILIENSIALKNNKIPENWKEKNKELCKVNRMKQVKLEMFINKNRK